MKNDYKQITLEWLEKADSDLNFAKASLKKFDDFYSQICILCHDAVEKYLKAYIISKGAKPKRIHDLVTLLKECIKLSKYPERLKTCEEDCRILNFYYTPLKYPSHYPKVTKEQAKEAVERAIQVGEVIKKEIGVC